MGAPDSLESVIANMHACLFCGQGVFSIAPFSRGAVYVVDGRYSVLIVGQCLRYTCFGVADLLSSMDSCSHAVLCGPQLRWGVTE